MTKTIRLLGTQTTALTWKPGEGPAAPHTDKVGQVIELQGVAATLVGQAMTDGLAIEIDGSWFSVLSAAISAEKSSYYIRATEKPQERPRP